MALARERCVYPAMLEEMVVRDTVKPTDCELTSQNDTSRPQVFDSGRYAIQAAEIVQSRLATEAVIRRAILYNVSYQSLALAAG